MPELRKYICLFNKSIFFSDLLFFDEKQIQQDFFWDHFKCLYFIKKKKIGLI